MMNVLFKIKDNYYVRIGRKYIKVDIVVKDDNVSLVPNNKVVIEDNKDLVVTEQVFDDAFKKKFIESRKPRPTEDKEEVGRNRFSR